MGRGEEMYGRGEATGDTPAKSFIDLTFELFRCSVQTQPVVPRHRQDGTLRAHSSSVNPSCRHGRNCRDSQGKPNVRQPFSMPAIILAREEIGRETIGTQLANCGIIARRNVMLICPKEG